MAAGSLTRHFGTDLLKIIAGRLVASWPDFPVGAFVGRGGELRDLGLMARISAIARFLFEFLPGELSDTWSRMKGALPAPLDERGKTFNDGYWMLPLAAFWGTYGRRANVITTIEALEALTQRGTSEFAVRGVIHDDFA